MLNKWNRLGEVDLSGEDILSLAWLHNGVLVSIKLIAINFLVH